MKVTAPAGKIVAALTWVSTIIPSRPSLIAYSGVYLSATKDAVTATASDDETSLTASLDAEETSIAAPGSALLIPKPIVKLLSTIPQMTPVTISVDTDTDVTVDIGKAAPYTFRTLATTFPTPRPMRLERQDTDLSALAPAMAAVAVSAGPLATSRDKIVQIVSDENGVKLHSTDRYRLTRAVLPGAASFGTFDGLAPVRILEIAAAMNPTSVQADNKGRIAFHATGRSLSTRLFSDQFPAVDTILGHAPPHHTRAPRKDTLNALKRLAAVCADGGAVTVAIDGDQMTLTAQSATLGHGTETVALPEASPAPLTCSVNRDFLASAVASHHQDDVILGWSEPLQPLFLTSVGGPVPVTNVLMPLQST